MLGIRFRIYNGHVSKNFHLQQCSFLTKERLIWIFFVPKRSTLFLKFYKAVLQSKSAMNERRLYKRR